MVMDFTQVVEDAQRTLLRAGEHRPTILVTFEGLSAPIRRTLRSFPATAGQRQHVLFLEGKLVGNQYSAWKVQRVWFISEGWMSTTDPYCLDPIAPSQDPKRREVLLVLELDASSGSLKQRIDIREMRRNKKKKLKALIAVPELSSASGQEAVTPHAVLALSFLAGFSEVASPGEAYRQLQAKIFQERLRMELPLVHHFF